MGDMVQPNQPGQAETQSDQVANGNGLVPLEDVRSIVAEAVQTALEKSRRDEQSQRDKLAARLRAEVEERIEELKGLGVTPNADQVRQIEANVRQKVTQAEPTSQPKPESAPEDPVDVAAAAIMEAAGIDIEDDDPEAKMMTAAKTPSAFIEATKAAVAAKRARLQMASNQGDAAQTDTPTPAPAGVPANARVVQNSGGTPSSGTRDALTAELFRLINNPSMSNMKRIHEIREKLAAMN